MPAPTMLWFLLGVLLVCSGIVSASETALFGLSRQALFAFRESRRRWLRGVYLLMQRPRRVLMTVLIANTTVNVAIFTISFFALEPLRRQFGVMAAVCTALVPVTVIVCGEMVPKAVAFSNARRFAPSAAGLIATLQVLLAPLQWLLARWVVDPLTRLLAPSAAPPDHVTTEELKLLVEHSAGEGVITSSENRMLQAIVALSEVSVREVMTPRVDIQWISLDSTREEAIELIRTGGRRRVPVCSQNLDDLRGVLYARDLYLHPDKPIQEIMRQPHFVPEQASLTQWLHHFSARRVHIAAVLDEYGGTSGLVTSKDVVQWIVGELPDADAPDPVPLTERVSEDTYRLSGDLSVRVWAERFGVDEIDRHFDTVGGLILAKLGRLPRVGESVRMQNLTLTVERMRRRRIEQVLLRHDSPEASAVERVS